LSLSVRLELGSPGALLGREQVYNVVVTAHAIFMIFFFVIPTAIGGFGNCMLPIFLIRSDMSLPRLNNLRF